MGSEVARPQAGADQATKEPREAGWVWVRDSEQAWQALAVGQFLAKIESVRFIVDSRISLSFSIEYL